jgi:hypothetical protein
MAGLGQYAGSFAAGFGQRMDYWREEDKKLSKQHKDAVDAIYQFARNNPQATQKDLENYALQSGVPDSDNILGEGGLERLAAELRRKRGIEQDKLDRERVIEGRQDKIFEQGQNTHFTELKLQEHEIFMKEMDKRLGTHKFMKMPMSEDQIGDIATATAEFLSDRHPQMDFDKVRKLYDYKSRLQQRAQNRQTKATAAARLIENTIAENPSKYSQPGEIEKLRKEVREANRFGPEVELISDERARQIQAAASEAQATLNFENQTQRRQKLHALLQTHSLSWTEADTQLGGRAWEDAKQVLRDMGIDGAKQDVFLSAFNPTRLKQEAEEAWMSDKSTQISNLAKQYGTVEGLMVGLGGRHLQLSQQTIDWINGQIQVNAPAREQNRDNFIINQMARKFANPRTVYHNVMQGNTKEFDAWIEELNNAKSTWGEVSREDILQIIHINQYAALQAELGADYAKLGNTHDQASTPDMVSIVKSEGMSQQLNELQQELLYTVINFDLINDKKSVSALAERIRKNNILADTTQPVNMLKQAEQLMTQVRADPNSAITIAQTREEIHKIKEEKRIKIATDFLADPGRHISNFEDDINGNSEKPMFGGIQADLDNLAKQSKQGDWSIGWQRQALANLRGESAKLREQIVAEQILLKRYGSGLPQKHYTQMQDNIKNAQKKRDAIVQRINEAEKSIGENQTKVTEESGLLFDARTFDLASLLGKIQTKWDTLEEEISSRQPNVSYVISDADIAVGVRMAEGRMQADKRILEEINNKIKAAGSPNLPLVEIPGIGPEGVRLIQEILDRDYNAIIDPRTRSQNRTYIDPMDRLDRGLSGHFWPQGSSREYVDDEFDIDM